MSATPEKKDRAWIGSPLRSPAQVGRRIGRSRQTVMRYFDGGELDGVDVRSPGAHKRSIMFEDDAVDRFLEKRKRITAAAEAAQKKSSR